MKKQNIVVLVGSYYPNFSAVGICVENIVNVLSKQANVTVVAQQTTYAEEAKITHNGYTIYRISTMLHKIYLYGQMLQKSTPMKQKIGMILSVIIRLVNLLSAIFSIVNIKRDWVRSYMSELNVIHKKQKIDTIIAFSYPFESCVAAYEFKQANNSVEYIPYIYDNFVEGALHRFKFNKCLKRSIHRELLEKVILNSKKVLAVHTYKQHIDTYSCNVGDKVTYVEHPLLLEPSPFEHFSNSNAKLFYAGAFLKNYVEPTFLLNTLEKLVPKVDFFATFFVKGNCDAAIMDFKNRYKDNIAAKIDVPMADVIVEMNRSDILICVAEYSGVQMSSKIFTYMSFGKPIILFYYADTDINHTILEKYPLYMGIKESDCGSSVLSELVEFVKTNRSKRLSFDEVKNIYPEALPGATINHLL